MALLNKMMNLLFLITWRMDKMKIFKTIDNNYNVFTENRIIVENHSSGNKRWISIEDVEKNNIKVNENEKPISTLLIGKMKKVI